MKQAIDKNRAIMFRASLESVRYVATALIEFLDKGVLRDATAGEVDQLVAQLGGGDGHLIGVLDDALDTLAAERTNYVNYVEIDLGAATYRVR